MDEDISSKGGKEPEDPDFGDLDLDGIDLDGIDLSNFSMDDFNLDDLEQEDFDIDLSALSSQLSGEEEPEEPAEITQPAALAQAPSAAADPDPLDGLDLSEMLGLTEAPGAGVSSFADDDDDFKVPDDMDIQNDIASQFFASTPPEISGGASETDMLDAMINEALAKEAEIDFNEDTLELSKDTLSLSRPASAYEDSEVAIVAKAVVETVSRRHRVQNKIVNAVIGAPTKYMYAVIAAVVLLILATSLMAYTILFGEEARRRNFVRDGGIFLQAPAGHVNSAHQIFIDNGHISLGDGQITLISAIFDSKESAFNFLHPVDQSRLNFFIHEPDGTRRLMNLRSLDLAAPVNTVRMQALSEGITAFTLTVADTTTGDYANIDFMFSRRVAYPMTLYVGARKHLDEGGGAIGLFLNDSTFSPASTYFSYSIVNNLPVADPQATYGFGPSLSLREGFGIVRPIYETFAAFDGGNLILGTLSAPPLRNLAQPIELRLDGLDRRHVLDVELSVPQLLTRGEPPTVIPLSPGINLFIEGMAHNLRSNTFILVLNTQDQRIPAPYDPEDFLAFAEEYRGNFGTEFALMNAFFRRNAIDPYFNRIETIANAYLMLDTPIGSIRFEGRPRHDRRGSDIVFDLSDVSGNVLPSQVRLVIESVELVGEPHVHILDMSALSHSPNLFSESFFADIIDQFEARLRFKSGEIGRAGLGTFDERVFAVPADFADIYGQAFAGEAIHNAQILAGTILNNRMYAIVRETWQADHFDPLGGHFLTYRVYAEQDEHGRWVVTHNELMPN
ncbi:MAG: hypothetical protein FWD98_03685 [Defluviitaleaceae bacterium]|nr:hypothetical protein [Defluviitaleaceae bacterium]